MLSSLGLTIWKAPLPQKEYASAEPFSRITSLTRLVLVNMGAVGLFYWLYATDNPKPYSNMAYFLLMGVVCWFYLFPQERIETKTGGKGPFSKVTIAGSGQMILLFLVARLGYQLINAGLLPLRPDNRRWVTFALPWLKINPFLSVSGIILVVVTLEWFYRAYCIGVLRRYCKPETALIVSSLLSSFRGFTLGVVPGIFDLTLSFYWGKIYLLEGLMPAIIVHLVWDLVFIYLSP